MFRNAIDREDSREEEVEEGLRRMKIIYRMLYEKGILTPESYVEDLTKNAYAMIRIGSRNASLVVKNSKTSTSSLILFNLYILFVNRRSYESLHADN